MAVSLKMNPGGKGTGDRADQFVTDLWSGTRTQLVRLAARLKEGPIVDVSLYTTHNS